VFVEGDAAVRLGKRVSEILGDVRAAGFPGRSAVRRRSPASSHFAPPRTISRTAKVASIRRQFDATAREKWRSIEKWRSGDSLREHVLIDARRFGVKRYEPVRRP
jgi:hypothetical protein